MNEACEVPLRRCAMLGLKRGAGSVQCLCWRRSEQFFLIWEHGALSMVATTLRTSFHVGGRLLALPSLILSRAEGFNFFPRS